MKLTYGNIKEIRCLTHDGEPIRWEIFLMDGSVRKYESKDGKPIYAAIMPMDAQSFRADYEEWIIERYFNKVTGVESEYRVITRQEKREW